MTRKELAALVDQLGLVKAETDELAKIERQLKDKIIAATKGDGVAEGSLYRASVDTCDRETLNRAMVEKLLLPKDFKKCLKKSKVTSVRVAAKSAAQTMRKVA